MGTAVRTHDHAWRPHDRVAGAETHAWVHGHACGRASTHGGAVRVLMICSDSLEASLLLVLFPLERDLRELLRVSLGLWIHGFRIEFVKI